MLSIWRLMQKVLSLEDDVLVLLRLLVLSLSTGNLWICTLVITQG